MDFEAVDLRADRTAAWYLKSETVQVVFAQTDGSLNSREGRNHYQLGDAVVTGSNGDRWSVSRERFDARYEPAPPVTCGADGEYRNKPVPVLAKQIPMTFSVRRHKGGDLLRGHANDWLVQYAPGDWGIVENAKFLRVYHRVEEARSSTTTSTVSR